MHGEVHSKSAVYANAFSYERKGEVERGLLAVASKVVCVRRTYDGYCSRQIPTLSATSCSSPTHLDRPPNPPLSRPFVLALLSESSLSAPPAKPQLVSFFSRAISQGLLTQFRSETRTPPALHRLPKPRKQLTESSAPFFAPKARKRDLSDTVYPQQREELDGSEDAEDDVPDLVAMPGDVARYWGRVDGRSEVVCGIGGTGSRVRNAGEQRGRLT